ncbi:alpha-tectorin-like [Discoglossus pictus]
MGIPGIICVCAWISLSVGIVSPVTLQPRPPTEDLTGSQATCSVSSGIHYRTFDGMSYNFHGSCSYTLVTTLESPDVPALSVVVHKENQGKTLLSLLKSVTVKVYGATVNLYSSNVGLARVDGVNYNLPNSQKGDKIKMYQQGNYVVIQTNFGLQVVFDFGYHIKIRLPSSYQRSVEGLCGDYNENMTDDLFHPNGALASSAQDFGSFWKTAKQEQSCNDECKENCQGPIKETLELYKADHYCGVLKKSNGPFKDCYSVISPNTYFNNCAFDLAISNGASTTLCASIQSYVSDCQTAGVMVQPWRNDSYCAMVCPKNSIYKLCADICSHSCSRLTDTARCPRTCAEGCECTDGYLFDGQQCVELENCGCFDKGIYYKPNQRLVTNQCTQTCTCDPIKGVSCEPLQCGTDEECEVKNGVLGCYKAIKCPENSHYEACGSACPASCSDKTAPDTCTEACVETCQCNKGYVLSSDKCVPSTSCGCNHNGLYYEPNEEFWSDESCSTYCRCDPASGKGVCSQRKCKSNQRCKIVNGKRGCHPSSYSTCTASGAHHYTTFDGLKFDFMGTSIYKLVTVTAADPTLTPFTVTVENNNRGNKAVPFTKVVAFEVYNQTIIISKDYPGQILVNGILTALPYNYETDKITAFIRGLNVYIRIDIEITVTVDLDSNARVILPATYANSVSGLCGNSNHDQADDFIMSNGVKTRSATEFGESWTVGKITESTNACVGNCLTCKEENKEQYKNDQYCGIITKANGPFINCHESVDPTPFFNDCVFDTCYFQGQSFAFSSVISNYAAACQTAGILIQEWRSSSFACKFNSPINITLGVHSSTQNQFAPPYQTVHKNIQSQYL